MRTTTAPTIRLNQYKKPAYLINSVDLVFKLDAANTLVTATLEIARPAYTRPGTPVELDGDELTLVGLKLDGNPMVDGSYSHTPQNLAIARPPVDEIFTLEITTQLAPAKNKKLMGLYRSNGVFCTQCEAQGFRRITYFPDRPDVLSVYTVRLEADETACPQLLSNGNLIEAGQLPDGQHFAVWHDPHPKPSYLFALVGGDLSLLEDDFTTASGRHVTLGIYVEKGKVDLAGFAMDALKRSMRWDEEVYGREYDLDVFNIVAVSDFNMGAMENKGLNIFNDKYVLANPDVATDADYMHIEAIIAHEYFHNWTGNRITCRDWFQLCLKEGLTVYRDQEFSADQRNRASQRIQQVKVLKAAQFAEDSGPLAHSVRPAAYREINNFYTATVYQKGAELVRMLATLVGKENYRKSTDLYFERHDGEAAVVEDWLKSFEDAAQIDLKRFSRWYEQAGTPLITVAENFDKAKQRYTLELSQSIAPTPGQKTKKPVPIPLRFGLLDKSGKELTADCKNPSVRDDVIVLDQKRQVFHFEGLQNRPILSINRGFSSPVTIKAKPSTGSLLLRARCDADLYNRWEAMNRIALKNCIVATAKIRKGERPGFDKAFIQTLVETAHDEVLDPEFRGLMLALPSEQEIAWEIGKNVDPDAIHKARKALLVTVGKRLGSEGLKLIADLRKQQKTAEPLQAAALRGLANALVPYLVAAETPDALDEAKHQFQSSENMTDRLSALSVLTTIQTDKKLAEEALETFYARFESNALVLDKWFMLQATIPGPSALRRVKKLLRHPRFSLDNPNRARSVLGGFAMGNPSGFHRSDGAAYDFYSDQILALDQINPQVAARLLTPLNGWKRFEAGRRKSMKLALQKIADHSGLSRDLQEIVDRILD